MWWPEEQCCIGNSLRGLILQFALRPTRPKTNQEIPRHGNGGLLPVLSLYAHACADASRCEAFSLASWSNALDVRLTADCVFVPSASLTMACAESSPITPFDSNSLRKLTIDTHSIASSNAKDVSLDADDVSVPIANHFFAMAEEGVESQTPTQAPASTGSSVQMILLVSAAVNVLLLVALFVVKMRKKQAAEEFHLGTPPFDDGLQTPPSRSLTEGMVFMPAPKAADSGAASTPMPAPKDTAIDVAPAPAAEVLDDESDSDQDVYVRTSSTISYMRFSGYPRSDESDSFRSSRHTDWRAYLLSSSSSLGSLSPFSSEGNLENPTSGKFATELATPPLPPVTSPSVVEIAPEVPEVELPAATADSSAMPPLPSMVSLFRSVTVSRLLAFRTKRGMHAATPMEPQAACA